MVLIAALGGGCGKVADGEEEDGDGGDSDHRADGGAVDPSGDGSVDGTGALEVDRGDVDFGNVIRGSASNAARFTVRNAGDGQSGSLATALAGDVNHFELVSDSCDGKPLAAGGTCVIEARFAPGAAGPFTAAVEVSADPGGEVRVELAGRGLEPGALLIDLDNRNFGRVNLADTSGVQTFEVSNTGDATTGALAVDLSDPDSFRLVDDNCSGQTLNGQGSCTVGVRFTPDAVGSANGSLTITASPGGNAAASLGGTGTATVTVVRAGTGLGSITSSPGGINGCTNASCSAEFDTPDVSLSASASGGSQFMSWGAPCAGTGSCDLDLDGGNVNIAATFEVLRTLTLSTSGSGTISAEGCTGSTCTYVNGASVVVTAAPDTSYRFGSWSGSCTGSGGCTVVMSQNRAVTANFETQRLNLTIADGIAQGVGPGVSVSLSTGQTCSNYTTCGYNWANPTTVTLTRRINPGDGNCTEFIGWSPSSCSDTSATCVVTVSGTLNVTAIFDRIPNCGIN